jgi:hypothetical protein
LRHRVKEHVIWKSPDVLGSVNLKKDYLGVNILFVSGFFFFFSVLELELRACTLSHSTIPFFVKGFSR